MLRVGEPQILPHKGVEVALPEGTLLVHVLVQSNLLVGKDQRSWERVAPTSPQTGLGPWNG